MNTVIRILKDNEITDALDLAWKVFNEYEAPAYSSEGVNEFYRSIHDDRFLSGLVFYGAFIDERLIGMLATRNSNSHIALFFIESEFHKKGIGRSLFETVRTNNITGRITVNSSPYAVEFYHKLGFRDLDSEQIVNGLRFIPMEYLIV